MCKNRGRGALCAVINFMRSNIYIIILLLASLLVACDKEHADTAAPTAPVTVGFAVDEGRSRTSIGDDGISTEWSKGDRVALWAKDEAGGYALDNQPFSIYFRKEPAAGACFTATIAAPMSAGQYTYYACYPMPQSVEGTRATFALPARQDGRVSGGADIMIAAPSTGTELRPLEIRDDDEGYEVIDRSLTLQMRHLLHVLRLYIPEGENTLGEPVTRIAIAMPQSVAGTVTADISDPAAAPALDDGTGTLILDLAEPLDASASQEPQYACASIFPPATPYAADSRMRITLYSENYTARVQQIDIDGRTFEAGHVTPVRLHPQQRQERYKYHLRLRLGENHLGEDVQSVTLIADGFAWDAEGNTEFTFDARSSLYGADGYYDMRFDDFHEEIFRAMGGKQFTVRYESEHAVVTGTQRVTIPDTTDKQLVEAEPLEVPYLFFEDFSATTNSHEYDSANATNVTHGGSNDAVDLSASYGWPTGWTGARCGISAGQAIRICCRAENAVLTPGTYNGRVDSPHMQGIKPDKSVKLKITFDYSMNKAGSKNSSNQHYLAVGTHNVPGPINASSGRGTPWSDPLLGYTINANIVYDVYSDLSGSYTTIDRHAEYMVDGCSSSTRFAWEVYIKSKSPDGYYNHWVYIDNIRVQIAQ